MVEDQKSRAQLQNSMEEGAKSSMLMFEILPRGVLSVGHDLGNRMNEAIWLRTTFLPRLVWSIPDNKRSERKLRLLACACCRRIWHLFDQWELGREAVEVAELLADGLASHEEVRKARQALTDAMSQSGASFRAGIVHGAAGFACQAASYAASLEAYDACEAAEYAVAAIREAALREMLPTALSAERAQPREIEGSQNLTPEDFEKQEAAVQCGLVRCIFENPFRPLPSRTFPSHLRGLAQAVYEGEAEWLPVLADALEDVGEMQAAAHCREPAHAKGCHVVDWILGKH